MRACVCFRVVLALFLFSGQFKHRIRHTLYFISYAQGRGRRSKEVDKMPPPPSPSRRHLSSSFCVHCSWRQHTKRSEELDRFSSVPIKSRGSSTKPTERRQTGLKPIPRLKTPEREGMPTIHRTLMFLLVQTSGHFILESL